MLRLVPFDETEQIQSICAAGGCFPLLDTMLAASYTAADVRPPTQRPPYRGARPVASVARTPESVVSGRGWDARTPAPPQPANAKTRTSGNTRIEITIRDDRGCPSRSRSAGAGTG